MFCVILSQRNIPVIVTTHVVAVGSCGDMRKNAHERLGALLCELKGVLQRYPTLHTIDILTMAALLITKIKSTFIYAVVRLRVHVYVCA